jgi:Tol biopolymer transport system component
VIAVFGQGEHEQVVAIDTTAGTVIPLTANAQYKAFPQWSPSGGQVAFVGAGGVWIINVQNKQEQLFLKGSYTDIQWISGDMTGFGAG